MRITIFYENGTWDEGDIDTDKSSIAVAAELASKDWQIIPFKDGRVLIPVGDVKSIVVRRSPSEESADGTMETGEKGTS